MQRDVSIGNLLKLNRPVNMQPFSIRKLYQFWIAVEDETKIGNRLDIKDRVAELNKLQAESGIDYSSAIQEVMSAAENLEAELAGLEIGTTCQAVVSDGDLACYLPTYFSQPHDKGALSVST